jgi:signal transduction histidine kinase
MNNTDRNEHRLGRVIATRAHDIEQRWLARVSAQIAGSLDVELTHLRDGIPDYLAELGRLMDIAPIDEAQTTASWLRVTRDHGITRIREHFNVDQLVSEFVTLRKTIEEVAEEEGVTSADGESALANLIDIAIAQSVHAYIDQRDYEARRVQAENIAFLIHELRNPLASAVQAESMLRARASPDQTKFLDILGRSHRRLGELIDSVLHTERLEAGKVQPHYARVSLGDLVENACAVARETARRKGLSFEVRAPAEPVMIDVDVELTRSAIANVVDNAVKYTDVGGVVVVIDTDDATWTVHVSDTGPGLSREELRTIFEPFRRGSTSKKGTGLGLAIARRAIEAQGGSIDVESPGLSGSHFWITGPRQRALAP